MQKKLINHFISNKIIALKFEDDLELLIPLKKLRKACPCAHCSGEKDIFGNIYKGKTKSLTIDGLVILKINLIGNYAIRVFWQDGHSNGIYPFDLLKNLSE